MINFLLQLFAIPGLVGLVKALRKHPDQWSYMNISDEELAGQATFPGREKMIKATNVMHISRRFSLALVQWEGGGYSATVIMPDAEPPSLSPINNMLLSRALLKFLELEEEGTGGAVAQ